MHHLDGRVERVSGTDEDRKAALEWLARFLPEARLGQRKPMPRSRRMRADAPKNAPTAGRRFLTLAAS